MTYRSAYVHANTLGHANNSNPEIVLGVAGPRGGSCGTHCLSPAEARRVAYELLMGADEVEATDFNLHYRGYRIEPCQGEETVMWLKASEFHVFQPDDTGWSDPIDVVSTRAEAIAAIEKDITQYD